MIAPEKVQEMIEAAMPEAKVRVEDPFKDQTHLKATIISSSFKGKTPIERHRMVYKALGDAFDGPLHALQITTKEEE